MACAQTLRFQQLQGSHLWIQASFALRGVRLGGISWKKNVKAPLSEPFFIRRTKMLSTPDGFMLYDNLGVEFSPLMKCYIQIGKKGYNKSEPYLFFTWLGTTPTFFFELFIVLFTLVVLLSRMVITKNLDMLAYTPVEDNWLETLAKTFNILARQNQLIQENNSNRAPVRRIAIAIKNLWNHGIVLWKSNLVSAIWFHKSVYSEEVSQLPTLMLLRSVAYTLQRRKQWTFEMISP